MFRRMIKERLRGKSSRYETAWPQNRSGLSGGGEHTSCTLLAHFSLVASFQDSPIIEGPLKTIFFSVFSAFFPLCRNMRQELLRCFLQHLEHYAVRLEKLFEMSKKNYMLLPTEGPELCTYFYSRGDPEDLRKRELTF